MMLLLRIKSYRRIRASIVEYMSQAASSCVTFVNVGFAMAEEILRAHILLTILSGPSIRKSHYTARDHWAKLSLNAIHVAFVMFLCLDLFLPRQILLSSCCAGKDIQFLKNHFN